MTSKHLPFYLITFALLIALISPNLFSDGMFIDGLLYAVISKNLANGLGSFWDLYLTHTYPHFQGHPPLAMGIQSLFFKLFGNSILLERVYSFCTFLITGYIITQIWKKISPSKMQTLAWLPLLFWVITPLVFWAASNNMLENTMMIFTSLSILFLLKSLHNNRFTNITLSGISLFLATITKGLVALFPLSFLFWVYIFKRNISFKRLIIDSFFLCCVLFLSFIFLFVFIPESLDSLTIYLNKQVVGSIKNAQTVNSRFFILWRLLNELIGSLVIVFIIFMFSRKFQSNDQQSKWTLVFLCLGLSGVLPIMISMKQSGFYILATFPFFSIALAFLIAPRVHFLLQFINTKSKGFTIFKYISFAFFFFSVAFSLFQIGKIGKDKNMIEDVHTLIQVLPDTAVISIQPSMRTNWSLHCYFHRYANISLDPDTANIHNYLLVKKGSDIDLFSAYKIKPIVLNLYDFYQKN